MSYQLLANPYSVLVLPNGHFLVGDPGSARIIDVDPNLPATANQTEFLRPDSRRTHGVLSADPLGNRPRPTQRRHPRRQLGQSGLSTMPPGTLADGRPTRQSCAGALNTSQRRRVHHPAQLGRARCSRRTAALISAGPETSWWMPTAPSWWWIRSPRSASTRSRPVISRRDTARLPDRPRQHHPGQPISAGGFYATPSRLDFNASVSDPRLLIADETGFHRPTAPRLMPRRPGEPQHGGRRSAGHLQRRAIQRPDRHRRGSGRRSPFPRCSSRPSPRSSRTSTAVRARRLSTRRAWRRSH